MPFVGDLPGTGSHRVIRLTECHRQCKDIFRKLDANGEPSFDVTIRGAFPRYSFRAIDAGFHGVDGSIHLGPDSILGIRLQGSAIRAYDLATDDFLVGTPPDRLLATLIGQSETIGPFRDTHLELSTEAVAEQSRVDACQDLAPAPDGYILLHASIGADLPIAERTWSIGVEAHNILNTKYREYTSLLRYYADQPGRDVRFHLSTEF